MTEDNRVLTLKNMILNLLSDQQKAGDICLSLEILTDLIDDMCLDVAFEVHKSIKEGVYCTSCGTIKEQITTPGRDIFGIDLTKAQEDPRFLCPCCERSVVASNYAPHLEKCMGLGRTARASSRLATRRMANSDHDSLFYLSSDNEDNSDIDETWHETV